MLDARVWQAGSHGVPHLHQAWPPSQPLLLPGEAMVPSKLKRCSPALLSRP